MDLLVHLGQQGTPVVIDLPQQSCTDTRVGDCVDVVGSDVVVVDDHAVRRNFAAGVGVVNAEIGIGTCKGRRNVVDIAAAALVVDHGAEGKLVGNHRQIDGRVDLGTRIPTSRGLVGGVDGPLRHVDLGLVGDVAKYTGLGAGAEQRSLRTLEHLDALEIGGIDVEVAAGYLS